MVGKNFSGKQMSEAFINSAFLALSGGFQDAYTYNTRGGVFSNAQTGNVVLMSQYVMVREWQVVLRYLLPLFAFAVGVLIAEQIQYRYKFAKKIHWRQGILLIEMIILFIVGFIPEKWNMEATILVSFACAMQVQAFRKVDGYAVASTMCIGNMRSGVEALSRYRRTGEREMLRKAAEYIGVILVFALGAGAGSRLLLLWGRQTIWINCVLLLFTVLLMMIPENEKEEKM